MPDEADRELVWSDEFDGANGALPDPDKWKLEQYADATDDEKQCYTNSADNVHTDGSGYLVISANKVSGNCADGWYRDITSARLTTKGLESWEHARFEIRAKMPTGVGTWPAFWAMGEDDKVEWPAVGEIDAMEYVGRDRSHVIGTVHGATDGGDHWFLQADNDSDTLLSADMHTYAVEWDDDEVSWYLDGEEYGTVTRDEVEAEGDWAFDRPVLPDPQPRDRRRARRRGARPASPSRRSWSSTGCASTPEPCRSRPGPVSTVPPMHRSRIGLVLVDHPEEVWEEALAFWAGVQGVTPTGEDEGMTEYRSLGSIGSVALESQRTGSGTPARLHLDIETDDVSAEVARVVALGATVLEEREGYTILQDPARHGVLRRARADRRRLRARGAHLGCLSSRSRRRPSSSTGSPRSRRRATGATRPSCPRAGSWAAGSTAATCSR